MKISSTAGRAAALTVGVVIGVSVVAAAGGLSDSGERNAAPRRPEPSHRPSSLPSRPPDIPPAPDDAAVMLAWTPGSLPPGSERALESLPGVTGATTVYAGLDWITSQRVGSRTTRPAPAGFSIPFEMAAVEPNEYAQFVAKRDRVAIRQLGPGEVLIAQTETELRGGGRGMVLDLGERSARVSGVVSDETTNGYEAIMAAPPPPEWPRADRFVLIKLDKANRRERVETALARLAPDQPVQTRMAGENPFLRYGDAVLPQLLVKATFGEFTARPSSGGTIEVEDRWERRNIRTARLPLIGEVRCHRLLLPQLRHALLDIKQQGLAHAIHPLQYSGCYYPRFISHDPTGRLSHHSWGMAIDLNGNENRFGARPNMDPRLVDIFEDRWGFTWGGRWIIPDGMHFEWIKFP